MDLKRSLAGAATLLVALSLTACGDDGDGGDGGGGGDASGGDSPSDASVEDFCANYKEITEMEEGEGADAEAEALNQVGEKLAETGTPEDIPDDARNGFEVAVDVFTEVDGDKVDALDKVESDPAAIAKELGISETDVKDMQSFFTYTGTTCAGELMDESPSAPESAPESE